MNRLISGALLATLLLSAYTSVAQQTFNERQVHGIRLPSAAHEAPAITKTELCLQSKRQASHRHHETDDKAVVQRTPARVSKKLRQE